MDLKDCESRLRIADKGGLIQSIRRQSMDDYGGSSANLVVPRNRYGNYGLSVIKS